MPSLATDLQDVYSEFESAERSGDIPRAQRAATKAKKIEEQLFSEQMGRYTEAREANPLALAGRGAADAVIGAGTSIRQGFNWATGDDEELERLLEEQRYTEFENAATRSTGAGMAGGMAAEVGMLAAPIGIAGHAMRGMGLGARLLGQSALGALEVPAIMPSSGDIEGYGTEKATQAVLGAGLGAGAELGGAALSGLSSGAKRLRGLLPEDEVTPPPSGAPAAVEAYTEIPAGQRAFISEGETAGVQAMQEGRQLAGSNVQKRIMEQEQRTQAGIERTIEEGQGTLPRLAGRNAETTGNEVKETLLLELGEREAAEEAAWTAAKENTDDLVLLPQDARNLFQRLQASLRGMRPNRTMGNVRALDEYLTEGLSANEGLTAGGLDNLRKDIFNFTGAPGSPEAGIVKQLYGNVSRMIDELVDEGGAVGRGVEQFRAATAASARKFDLTNQQVTMPNKKKQLSILSKAINHLEAGTWSNKQFIETLMSGRGSKMLEFLDEAVATLGPEKGAVIRESLRDGVLDKMLTGHVQKMDGRLGMKNDMSYKAMANQIKKFMNENREMMRALFDEDEIVAMDKFGDAVRTLEMPKGLGRDPASTGSLFHLVTQIPGRFRFAFDKAIRKGLRSYDDMTYGKKVFGDTKEPMGISNLLPMRVAAKAVEKTADVVSDPRGRGLLMSPAATYDE